MQLTSEDIPLLVITAVSVLLVIAVFFARQRMNRKTDRWLRIARENGIPNPVCVTDDYAQWGIVFV